MENTQTYVRIYKSFSYPNLHWFCVNSYDCHYSKEGTGLNTLMADYLKGEVPIGILIDYLEDNPNELKSIETETIIKLLREQEKDNYNRLYE